MGGPTCSRCGDPVEARYCHTCGLDQRSNEPVTSRNEAALAADTERLWRDPSLRRAWRPPPPRVKAKTGAQQPAGAAATPRAAVQQPDTKTCPRCAETVKPAAQVCRYCGHEFDRRAALHHKGAGLSAVPAVPTEFAAGQTAKVLKRAFATAAVVVVVLWFTGALDKPLSSVHLNKNACVQNAFGATFCGDDAKRVCRQFGGPGCREAGYSTKGSLEDGLNGLDDPSTGS